MIVLHPNCLGGGGGERVAWEIISILLRNGENVSLFTSSLNMDLDGIVEEVGRTFGIKLRNIEKLEIIPLFMIFLLNSKLYPIFSILFQAFGQIIVGLEIVIRRWFCRKDVTFIDTFHLPFSVLVIGLFERLDIHAYVHFPFIYSHSSSLYHRMILHFYRKSLLFYKKIMVNSSFTLGELSLISPFLEYKMLYPPCFDVPNIKRIKNGGGDLIQIVSLSQFRPMKRHIDQIKIVSKLSLKGIKICLKMIGGIGDDQRSYVNHLKEVAESFKVDLEVIANATQNEIITIFSESHIGLHTMHNEHFGIAIVDMISAGLLVMAHRSGGPLLDIIKDERFLFKDVDDCYMKLSSLLLGGGGDDANDIFTNINRLSNEMRINILKRFSSTLFEKDFLRIINK